MKKVLVIAVLGVFLLAGAASAHMAGWGRPGYRHHAAYAHTGFKNPEAQKKFLEESYPLRKELNGKRFELREALRLDRHEKAAGLRKDIGKLRSEIGKIARNYGWAGLRWRKDCPRPHGW